MSRSRARWVFGFVGVSLLAGLVWVFAPLWPVMEPALPRIAAIQALFVAWAAANAALDWRRRAREAALGAGLGAEEASAVGRTLSRSVALLRRSGRRHVLTELPWYAIIGPPGAGKTTALLNAGLSFTLPDQLGQAAIAGAGGTRLCEWWFTDQAVLIDTAGRYTTQDSDAEVDRAGWNAFLSLLKRTRPHQPLNGVIVAIGLPDVLQATEAERAAHAAAIARRIAELETRFALRLPVYALFTKADLVAGFSETFEGLDAPARAQVWGETYALSAPALQERVAATLRTLAATLAARMMPTLAAEHRPDRWPAIAGFPTQFASLQGPLAGFVAAAFAGAPLLRGVYFASGTQEGTPMDRLTGTMSRAFGLPATRPASLSPQAGRAYFLHDLLHRVIFNEALLVRDPRGAASGRRPGGVRWRAIGRVAGFVVLLVALAAAAAGLDWTAGRARAQLDFPAAALSAYSAAASPLAARQLPDDDLRWLAPVLDQAEALLPAVPDTPIPLGFGQAEKLKAGARGTYRDALTFGLLPRLVARMEAAMRGALGRPILLYEITRIGLMLGGAGPLDPAQVHDFMAREWSRTFADDPALQASLLHHLDDLLTLPLPPVPLDGALVAAARASIAQVPPADRIYANLRSSAAALPAWRPVDALGPAGSLVFTRASGLPMTDGIPGLFTASGYRSSLQPGLDAASRRLANETWVTGRAAPAAPAELQALEKAVTALYLDEFTRRWDAMLADLDIAPLATLPQAAQALYIIASPESPMRALLRSAGLALQLPPGPATGPVLARYAPLIARATGDGAALEHALRLVADIQQPLAKIAALPVGTAAPPGGADIGAALLADAATEPQPLARWLSRIAAVAQALRTGNARQQLVLLYNAPGGPAQLCAGVTGRYPFNPAASQLPLEDFARVFAPGGALDAFFNTQLKPFIDTGTRPWKAQAGAPLRDADAAQFQRAAAIREAYFSSGAAGPGFTVDVRPLPPGRAAPGPAVLSVAGTTIPSGPDAPASQVTWPPAGAGSQDATLEAGSGLSLHETGPWAFNRLVSHARIQPAARPGHLSVLFGTPPATAGYDIGTTRDPFAPGLFADFRCPVIQ